MRILLDECLSKRLKREFGTGHFVLTVPEAGWAGTQNGRLIAAKFWIAPVRLAASGGFRRAEINAVERIVVAERERFLEVVE